MSIPAVHALHLAELVARWNVTPEELFAGLDLDDAVLAEPMRRLPMPVIEELVARARRLTGEPGLGFYLGLQMRVSSHGYHGFAAMSSSTAGAALELAVRFAPTRTSALALRAEREGNVASVILEEREALGEARDVIVLALIIGIQRIGSALTGHELVGHAEVAFPEPAYAKRFTSTLKHGLLRFDMPQHRLVFDAKVLDLPLTMADPAALRLARDQCEKELSALGYDGDLVTRVRGLVQRDADGFRSVEEVASALSLSSRTLKRKLEARGTSFSVVLEDERKGRALRLLATDVPLQTIADRLGYSDVANFTRAFRRWTGATPGAYRRKQ
ncbi:MAG: Transcriptional regulator, AraC family protein [Myxococcaceae bacterium]|nr:Transcriptional regulator, AraC family protein [Myxococcaceae bacterium]